MNNYEIDSLDYYVPTMGFWIILDFSLPDTEIWESF